MLATMKNNPSTIIAPARPVHTAFSQPCVYISANNRRGFNDACIKPVVISSSLGMIDIPVRAETLHFVTRQLDWQRAGES